MGDAIAIGTAKKAKPKKPRGKPFSSENQPANVHRFAKGVSGNPAGRPKVDRNLRDSAREHSEAALQALADIVADEKAPASARVQAAVALLDRGHGRPVQPSVAEITSSERTMSVTVAELMAMAERAEP